MESDRDYTVKSALAVLVCDLGTFWQRAGRPGAHGDTGMPLVDRLQHLFPSSWLDDLHDGTTTHSTPATKNIQKIVTIARRLASVGGEGECETLQQTPNNTPLLSVAARVEFREDKPVDWQRWGYRLNALRLEEACVFPTTELEVCEEDYQHLWGRFETELRRLKPITGYFGFISLLALLRKYTSFMPATTSGETDEAYRRQPDISLYDHLKVTAAIAGCLNRLDPTHLNALYQRHHDPDQRPVACLLRADISGIQSFLYRIAQAEPTAEFRNTAKRLRGRSFFLTILADVIADWFVRELGLLPSNVLFCGGGRFDLLIGADEMTEGILAKLTRQLQDWFLREFYGELGIELATVALVPSDFENLEGAFGSLDDALARQKQRKFRWVLPSDQFFVGEQLYHVCNYCHVTPMPQDGGHPCLSCTLQRELGHRLPHADYLAYLYGASTGFWLQEKAIPLTVPCGVIVALLTAGEMNQAMRWAEGREIDLVLYRLNNTDFPLDERPQNVAIDFKFLGNRAPVAREGITPNPVKPEKEPIGPGETLDFDEVASMSSGARLLGVLKADVDYLGQAFGLGLQPKTIARVAALSSMLDLFFAGWINHICDRLASAWHSDPRHDHPLKAQVDGLFYTVYSGGDDVLILGPWDAVVDLAGAIYREFRAFTCHNDNLTLSAGILLVKPHFPIQRFAQLAGQDLERSKTIGERQDHPGVNRKDRLTLFKETMRWQAGEKSVDRLVAFAKKLATHVGEERLPRSFIYSLIRLYDQHLADPERQDPRWVPKLYYTLARNVSQELMNDADLNLLQNLTSFMPHIRLATSYVSLKMRRD